MQKSNDNKTTFTTAHPIRAAIARFITPFIAARQARHDDVAIQKHLGVKAPLPSYFENYKAARTEYNHMRVAAAEAVDEPSITSKPGVK